MIFTLTPNPAIDREYVVPKLIPNTVLRAVDMHIDYGGKGFNVSRMLNAMDVGSTALGFIGGHVGRFLEKGMESLGIDTDFVHIEQDTRTTTTIVETKGHDHYKVNESGPPILESELDALIHKVKLLVRPGDWWVLAGSLPPRVPVNFYQTLIGIIQSAGAKAILDASGKALLSGVKARPYLIKPNVFEAGTLTGLSGKSMQDRLNMLTSIHTSGIALILISAGKEASIFSDGANTWVAHPPVIEEANPTGAGDAMLAGLLYGLVNGLPRSDSFAWGLAAGSAAASKTGTRMPSMEAVTSLKETITVQEISHAS